MSAHQFWNHYPPQQQLVLPQPRLRWEVPPFFCRPQWLVNTTSDQVESLAFFVALHLPSQPGVLHIESLHRFVAYPWISQTIIQQWQQLARLSSCRHLHLRSVVLLDDGLFYPSTGFCSSPSNPPLVPEQWLIPMRQAPTRQFHIWRLLKPQGSSTPPPVIVLDTQSTPPPWPWYSVGERLQIQRATGNSPLLCRRYVNLYPAIQHYGRMPELLQPGDWPPTECRLEIESSEQQWEPSTLGATVGYLNQQGYLQYEIVAPVSASWLAHKPWNGRIHGEVCDWDLSPGLLDSTGVNPIGY